MQQFAFSFLLAIAQIVRKKPEPANYLNSAVFICNSILQLGIPLISLKIPSHYPLSIFAFTSAIFFLGPLMFFYSYSIFNPLSFQSGLPARLKAHLIPGIFQLQPVDYKRTIIDSMLNNPGWNTITLLCLAGSIHISLYFIYMLLQGMSIRDVKSIQVPVRIMYSVYFVCMLSIAMVSYGFFTKSGTILTSGGALVTAINVFIFLINHRYPRFFRLIESEIKKKRYERSLLYGIDTELLNEQLNALMTDKSIYRDFDITLEKLGDMLLITPHQLSQFLNERLNTNFRQYINSYRIEEAKKLLINNPEQSIISICFTVGFGSKSTLNEIFKKFTGENPSDFRNRHAIK
jgi:AraC-like DNA-binding protein